jgi:hypothetical protein
MHLRGVFAITVASVFFLVSTILANDPTVSSVSARQRENSKLVDISYNLAATAPCTVSIRISSDDGATWNVPRTSASGHIGANVAAGTGKQIVWNAGADWNGQWSDRMRVEVTAVLEGNRFIDNGDNTITDSETGLMWSKRADYTSVNWPAAASYVTDLNLAGHENWRLPTANELLVLADEIQGRGNNPFLGYDKMYFYWTPHYHSARQAYTYIRFIDRFVGLAHYTYEGGKVWPVRNNN